MDFSNIKLYHTIFLNLTESFEKNNLLSGGPPIPIIAGIVSTVVILILISVIGFKLVWQRRR